VQGMLTPVGRQAVEDSHTGRGGRLHRRDGPQSDAPDTGAAARVGLSQATGADAEAEEGTATRSAAKTVAAAKAANAIIISSVPRK
jgi:hypothetical protein